MAVKQQTEDTRRRLRFFTPLRYPGGKGKLTPFVKAIIRSNRLSDGQYVEPYAGGCAVGLQLLLHEHVSALAMNDVSPFVYAFWKSVLDYTDELCRRIVDIPVTPTTWKQQKQILVTSDQHDTIDVGFATFFLNRTNRSGILNGGMIGGQDQSGPWKIDARYNAPELAFRVESIARLRSRISLSGLDAVTFIQDGILRWPKRTLIYCDPPYYEKGSQLYYDYYRHSDHVAIAEQMQSLQGVSWIVSYDNATAIRDMYQGCTNLTYLIGYSARRVRQEAEVMFFSDSLTVPPLCGPLSAV